MKHVAGLTQSLVPGGFKLGPFFAKTFQVKIEPDQREDVSATAVTEEFSNLLDGILSRERQEPRSHAPLIAESAGREKPAENSSAVSVFSNDDDPPTGVLPGEAFQPPVREELHSLNARLVSTMTDHNPQIETAARVEVNTHMPKLKGALALNEFKEPDAVSFSANGEHEDNVAEDAAPLEKPDRTPIVAAQPIVMPLASAIGPLPQKEPGLAEPTQRTRSGKAKDAAIQAEGEIRKAPKFEQRGMAHRTDQDEQRPERQDVAQTSLTRDPVREWPASVAMRVETSLAPSQPSPAIQFASQVIEAATPAQHANPALPARINPQGDVVKTLRFSLRPEHLGGVIVAMRLRGGELELRVEVETAEAHAKLVEDQSTLRQVLADAGYAVSETSVILMPPPDQAAQQRSPGDARAFDQSATPSRHFNEGQGNQRQESSHAQTWRKDEKPIVSRQDDAAGPVGGLFL